MSNKKPPSLAFCTRLFPRPVRGFFYLLSECPNSSYLIGTVITDILAYEVPNKRPLTMKFGIKDNPANRCERSLVEVAIKYLVQEARYHEMSLSRYNQRNPDWFRYHCDKGPLWPVYMLSYTSTLRKGNAPTRGSFESRLRWKSVMDNPHLRARALSRRWQCIY